MNQRLFRSPDDRILAGVAGGMAETYDLDPALVRVGWALLILVSGGIFLVLYIIMALVVPLRPMDAPLPWATAFDAPGAPAATGGPDTAPTPPGAPAAAPTPPAYDQWRYGRRHRHDGSGALLVGLVLIGAGAFFLVRQYLPSINADLLWPLVAIAVGVLLIVAAFGRPGMTR